MGAEQKGIERKVGRRPAGGSEESNPSRTEGRGWKRDAQETGCKWTRNGTGKAEVGPILSVESLSGQPLPSEDATSALGSGSSAEGTWGGGGSATRDRTSAVPVARGRFRSTLSR